MSMLTLREERRLLRAVAAEELAPPELCAILAAVRLGDWPARATWVGPGQAWLVSFSTNPLGTEVADATAAWRLRWKIGK